jgi:hypothetical protein
MGTDGLAGVGASSVVVVPSLATFMISPSSSISPWYPPCEQWLAGVVAGAGGVVSGGSSVGGPSSFARDTAVSSSAPIGYCHPVCEQLLAAVVAGWECPFRLSC